MGNFFGKLGAHKKKAGLSLVMVLALPLTAQYEGLQTKSYLDPVGIKTVCYGETQADMDKIYTKEECGEMLSIRLGYFSAMVDKLVTVDMSPQEHAAYSSFSYNVGIGEFKNSTLLKYLNSGQHRAACNSLNYKSYDEDGICHGYGCGWAGGKQYKGLQKRRGAERTLCLSGL